MLVEWELWGRRLKSQGSELEIYSIDILNIEYYLKESEERILKRWKADVGKTCQKGIIAERI